MKGFAKFAMAAALVGATALAAATPSEARNGRNTAAAIGFGAGALVGAAAASSAANNNYYYGSGYYEPGYAYAPAPTYSYEPAYADDYYAYEPAPVYAPRYRAGNTWERSCGGSPGKSNYRPCGSN